MNSLVGIFFLNNINWKMVNTQGSMIIWRAMIVHIFVNPSPLCMSFFLLFWKDIMKFFY